GGIKTAGNSLTINGSLTQNASFSSTVDLNAVSAYFASVGTYAASLPATTSYTNNFGELIVSASGPLTVVNFSTGDFSAAWGVRIVGAGAVICNVGGSSITLSSKTWTYTNGAASTDTLLNMNQATTLNLSGGNTVNMLAANAATHFSSGLVTGNLIVGSLTGSGQVNWPQFGGFNRSESVPAPGVAATVALAALGCTRRRRRA
ncbi:MAG: collagen-binding domain-containing protein, partial [Phycisphaerales bacterium]